MIVDILEIPLVSNLVVPADLEVHQYQLDEPADSGFPL